ncbi:dihydrofolate reductase family protein [Pendulispora brunnea]|uniref:Dihydrofolate reductase family protein n=2 Tax=Pendulispora brunnea TaxID=2905690 RepID=A0ABZ2JVV0_9BACT
MSIDGFVGGPNGEVDWLFRSMDDRAARWVMDTLSQAGVHIMGSRTYHDMVAYWPSSTEPFAAPMNEIPKVVFSRKGISPGTAPTTAALADASRIRDARGDVPAPTPAHVAASWSEARVARDLVEEIARLKQQDGKIILAHGGASFAQSLVEHDLVDEYRLLVHPVVLGRGLPIFSRAPAGFDFRLVSTTAFPSGVIANVYQRA